MKATLMLAVLALVLAGCNNRADELQKQNDDLRASNQKLGTDVQTRDEYVNKLTDAINDVYGSLEEIRVKEHALVKRSGSVESGTSTVKEVERTDMVERLGEIRTALRADYEKLTKVQGKLSSLQGRYAGLEKMVANLKQTITERDQAITELTTRVEGLKTDVARQTVAIAQKDSVIDTQYRTITTTYYIAGTKHELEQKGIIKDEGGFLWGLLGSTTTLASGFDERLFKPLNKEVSTSIEVNGKIDEILPARAMESYSAAPVNGTQSLLTIAAPDRFWKEKYLVIITDRENNMNMN